MCFSPATIMLKRLYNPFIYGTTKATGTIAISNSIGYTISGALAGYAFKGNSESLALAFSLTSLVSGIFNVAITQEAQKKEWKAKHLQISLTAVDAFANAILYFCLLKVHSLHINTLGLGIAGGLLGMDLALLSLDAYRACRNEMEGMSRTDSKTESTGRPEGVV